MPGVIDFVRDADSLAALAPEDLGMIVLQLVQNERGNFTRSSIEMPLWTANSPGYPQHKGMQPVAGRCLAA